MPNLYNFALMGDQNFLNYALFDLKFEQDRDARLRQSGMCVSGMKIREAFKKVEALNKGSFSKVIVNLGTVDIAEGRKHRND